MIAMRASEIADVVGGRLEGADFVFSGSVVMDSRDVEAGSLFVALPGEHVDGHDYVQSAVDSGAALALVARDLGAAEISSIIVPDVGVALIRLAAEVRARLPHLTVVGITGSQGKTTTKDILLQVLNQFDETVAPKDSFNNEIGLPLTILKCSQKTKYLVLEFGATHIGDIEKLASIADIDVAVVLVVGNAHVGEFGSLENIAQAKFELVQSLSDGGVAVLGTYDPHTIDMALRAPGQVVTFGPHGKIHAEKMSLIDGEPVFLFHDQKIHLHFTGAHQVANAEAVLAICESLNLDTKKVVTGLNAARPLSKWRMERSHTLGGALLLNDCYNANPESMAAALVTVAEIGRERAGRAVAILGEMRELGESSRSAHESIGRLVAQLEISQLVGIGGAGETMVKAALLEGHKDARSFGDHEAALRFVEAGLHSRDVILVKASRGTHLEGIAARLAGGGSE